MEIPTDIYRHLRISVCFFIFTSQMDFTLTWVHFTFIPYRTRSLFLVMYWENNSYIAICTFRFRHVFWCIVPLSIFILYIWWILLNTSLLSNNMGSCFNLSWTWAASGFQQATRLIDLANFLYHSFASAIIFTCDICTSWGIARNVNFLDIF